MRRQAKRPTVATFFLYLGACILAAAVLAATGTLAIAGDHPTLPFTVTPTARLISLILAVIAGLTFAVSLVQLLRSPGLTGASEMATSKRSPHDD